MNCNKNYKNINYFQGYVHFVKYCSGVTIKSFKDLNSVMAKANIKKLEEIYDCVEDIDLYVGGLAEKPIKDGIIGPTFGCLIAEQFHNLKFGDRFYYEHCKQAGSFSVEQLDAIRKTTLAGIVCANGDNISPIQRDVFEVR